MFNEKIKWYHYFGIGFISLCAVFIGVGRADSPVINLNGEEISSVPPYITVLIALLTPALFALRNIWVRIAKIKGGMCPGNLTLASSCSVSLILVVISFITLPLEEFAKEIFFRMLIASFLSIIALMFLSHAMVSGYAGPVCALANV
jgi:hypothetical protein